MILLVVNSVWRNKLYLYFYSLDISKPFFHLFHNRNLLVNALPNLLYLFSMVYPFNIFWSSQILSTKHADLPQELFLFDRFLWSRYCVTCSLGRPYQFLLFLLLAYYPLLPGPVDKKMSSVYFMGTLDFLLKTLIAKGMVVMFKILFLSP